MQARLRERAFLVAVIAIAAASVLLVGGAQATVQVALSAACLVLVVAWVATSDGPAGIKLSPLSGALLAAVGVTALQLVPLPRFLVGLLSPQAVAARADALGHAPAFLPLTLDASETSVELVKVLGFAGLFVAVAAVAYRRRRATPLLAALAALGSFVAVAAIVERLVGTDKILGLYRPAWCKTFIGTFVDSNHAAELFGLSLCISIGLSAEPGRTRPLAVGAAALNIAGLALSLSRGGIAAAGFGAFLLLTLIFAQRFGRIAGALMALILVAVGAAACVVLFEPFSHRFSQVSAAYLAHNQKVDSWRDALPMLHDFRWTGVGRGAFLAPFQRYRTVDDGTTIAHPENLLLQLYSEWGAPAATLVLALAAAAIWKHRKRARHLRPAEWGAVCGALAVTAQNLVDFGLELSGIALPVAIAVGVVVARACAKLSVQRWRVSRRLGLAIAGGWALALVLAAISLPHTLRADDDRLMALVQQRAPLAEIDAAATAAIVRHPADYHLELLDATAHVRAGDPASMHHINRVLRLRPLDVEAHRLAGYALARAGHPAQASLEYRKAFAQSNTRWNVFLDEAIALLGLRAVDAMPQTTDALLLLANRAGNHRPQLADAACFRAADLAPDDEHPALAALRLATEAHDNARIARAAGALERSAHEADTYVAAAAAFRDAGRPVDARRVLSEGLARLPDDSALGIAWAQVELDAHEFAAARATLRRLEQLPALETRKRAAELRVTVEEGAGNPMEAAAARTRARIYSRALADSSPTL